MKREFLLNIILLLSINFLVKPLYLFGVDLQIQNIVGEDTYGMYKVLFNIAFLLQFVHEPGIQSFNSQNISKNPEKLSFHFPRILGLKLILGIIYMVIATVYFLSNPYDKSLLLLMIVIAINLFLSTLFIFLRTNISAIGKYRIDSLLSSIDKVLMLVILGFLTWFSPYREQFQIIWLAYGQMVAFGISCLVAFIILHKHMGKFEVIFSWDYSKKLIRWSLPYALILLSMSAYTRMDSIMLERILDDGGRQSGVYEYGYRILDALNMIGYLFASLLLPMYAANIKDHKTIDGLADISMRIMTCITFIGAATGITYRHEIMQWAREGADPYYGQILLYLMLSFVALSMAYIFGSLLVANNTLKRLNILLIMGVVVNFGLNYWLIPHEEALGAAKATLVTQVLMTIGQIYLCVRLLHLKIDRYLFMNIIVFGLFCALIYFGIYSLGDFEWIIKATMSILLSVGGAFLLRLISIESMSLLIKKD